MSEQNQLAISPVAAGLTGAAIGGVGNYFLGVGAKPAKGYGSTKELLTLEKDKFEALAKAVEEKGDDAAKAEFKKLADGRVTVSAAGDALIKEQDAAKKQLVKTINDATTAKTVDVKADTELTALTDNNNKVEDLRKKMGGLSVNYDETTEKATITRDAAADAEVTSKRAELKTARANARKAITDKTDDGLGKELKEATEELTKATTDDAKKVAQAKIDTVNTKIAKAVSEDANVKTAKEALNVARKKILTEDSVKPFTERHAKAEAYRNKLVENLENTDAYKNAEAKENGTAIEKLKHEVSKLKETLAKKVDDAKTKAADDLVGDNGALKDLDTSKFGKFLKKSKMWPTIIAAGVLGAAGVALAYIVGPKNPTPKDVA